jgi:membrane-bound lytic murein transglycosylase
VITRAVVLGILAAALARSQPATAPHETLATLEATAQRTVAAWQVLARDLDLRLARMLPCDARAKTAIDEVARASQARLAALDEYYEAAAHDAKARRESASVLVKAEEARLAETAAAAAQADESVSALSNQLELLTESVKLKSNLDSAASALKQNQTPIRDGAANVKTVATRRTPLIAALKEFVNAAEAREAALAETRLAFEAERARWNGYYAARLARSETECAIISPAAAPAKPAPRSSTQQPAAGKAK